MAAETRGRPGLPLLAVVACPLAGSNASAQVASIVRGGLGNNPAWNWPAGTWEVAALLLDGNGLPVGGLSTGFSRNFSGTIYPAFVTVDMVATAPDASHVIRVYRVQGSLGPGTFGADYADYSCDAGGGTIADFCDASTSASPINGNGLLREIEFLGTGTVLGGGEGVGLLTRNGLGNSPSRNWPAGTWEVAAILLDGSGRAVGGLSAGFSRSFSGTIYPAFVEVDMLASAPDASHTLRVYRVMGTLAPGVFGADYADYSCDAGGGVVADFCDADSSGSPIDGNGVLSEEDFLGTGTVPGGGEGVGQITRGGLGNSPSRNWPAGTWEVTAFLIDGKGRAVGGLAAGFSRNFSGTTYPAFVDIDMLASARSANARIRVLRKQGTISGPEDPDAEFADFSCSDGAGGLAAACDADSAASPIDGGQGILADPDFAPVTPLPAVPALGGVGKAAAVALLLVLGFAAASRRRA